MPHPPRPSPPPFLLFRQTALLCALAGMLTAFTPWPALGFFLLLCLYNLPRRPRFPLFLCLCGAFALGAGYAHVRAVEEPPVPPLLRQAAERSLLPPGGVAPAPVFVKGTVTSPLVLPDGRIRAVLEDVTLEQESADALAREGGTSLLSQERYTGGVLWTWSAPRRFVQAGDTLRAQVEIFPLRGLANPHTWDTEQYWKLQGVFFRATSNAKARVDVLEPAGGLSRLRTALYTRFLLALPAENGAPLGQLVAGANAAARAHPLLRTSTGRGPQAREHPQGDTRGAPPPAAGNPSPPASSSLASPPATTAPPALPALAPSPGARLLPALLFGDRSFLPPEQVDRIARSTLAHSLALSGLHLGYAVIVGAGAALVLGVFAPRLWLHCRRQTVALVCAVPFALLYLWLGQAPLSLLRAACMLFFWVLLIFLHRPKVLLDGLLAAVVVLALFDPSALVDLRLQLSALSIAAMAVSMPLVRRLIDALCPQGKKGSGPPAPGRALLRRLCRGAIAILLLSLCIQVALLPLTVSAFGTVGLWFPLNVLWLPVLGAVVMPLAFAGLLAAAAGFTGAAHVLLTLAGWPCDLLLRGLAFLDEHGLLLAPVVYRPGWVFWAGFWLLCLYLPAWWLHTQETGTLTAVHPADRHPCTASSAGRFRLRGLCRSRSGAFLCLGVALCAGSLVWAAWWRVPPGVGLRLLDVGHGQAALVEWRLPGGAGRALIDGGSFSPTGASMGKTVVAPTLTAWAWPSVDWVINSHPDTDHLGGLLYLLENMHIGAYAGNGEAAAGRMGQQERAALAASGLHQQILHRGQRLALAPDLRLEVLWPPPLDGDGRRADRPHKARNDSSLLLRLVWQEEPLALFCGDLERTALETITGQAAASLPAQVLVLPHHGSRHSLLPAFYDVVRPRAALVSTGFGNQWHFPHAEVRAAWAARGVPLLNTAETGHISIHWTSPGEAFMLTTARP